MTRRRLANLARPALNSALVALLVWQEFEAFKELQEGSPGAGLWAFMIDRGTLYSSAVLGGVAIFALAMWLESLPTTDADRTEFHEKETN